MAAKRRVVVRAEVVPEPAFERPRKKALAVPERPEPSPGPVEKDYVGKPREDGAARMRDVLRPYRRLLLKKPLDELLEEGTAKTELRRTLGPVTLTLLGIAGIIGIGIFVLTGVAAQAYSGNMIWASFAIAGVVAALAAFSYSELSSMIPVAGSAYTYSYAGVGEAIAWVIGWDLVLEYAVGAMTVAQGWAGYTAGLLAQAGYEIPYVWLNGPLEGGYINMPAVIIVLAITALVVYGIHETASVANTLVAVKVGIIVFVVLMGFLFVTGVEGSSEATFFLEPHATQGTSGILTAAGLVFFAYVGFDALSTVAEETKNPRRNLPIGILASLGISTVLYILASMALVRMVPYDQIDLDEPFGAAFETAGYPWAAAVVRVSAVAGITSILIVLLTAQPRIFFAMSRDGLLPPFLSKIHPTFRTPWLGTLVTGVVVAFVGGLLPIDVLALVTNIGTLFAFVLVGASVIILRYTAPHVPRGYKVPGPAWLLPGLGAVAALGLMAALPRITWLVFLFWLGAGLVIYAAYGYRKSRAAAKATPPSTTTPDV